MPDQVKKRTRRLFPGFVLQFPVTEIDKWATEYGDDYADQQAFTAGDKIRRGDFTAANLQTIVNWKSERRASLISTNTDSEIEEALRLASNAAERRTAFGVLMGLAGVGVPMASAILTAIDRERYTVIDWRALQALGVPADWGISLEFYLKTYLPECMRISVTNGKALRTVDRALWGWSKHQSARAASRLDSARESACAS